MIRLDSILNRVIILVIRLEKDGEPKISMSSIDRKGKELIVEEFDDRVELEKIGTRNIKDPVLLMITGHGIIRKVYRGDEMNERERITNNDEFLWDCLVKENGDNVIAFTRKDRVSFYLEKLEQNQVPVIDIHVGNVVIEDSVTFEQEMDTRKTSILLADQFYKNGIKWKELARAGKRGNILSSLMIKRIKLPLLLCLLGLLLVNYLWNSSVREKYVRQQAELTLLEKNVSNREKLSREMEQVIREFKGKGKNSFTPVLDKIASLVPEEVILETLTLNPLVKTLEDNKPLITREGFIELAGITSNPEKVTAFTSKLTGCDFTRQVKLISLDKNRESGVFNFKIRVGL